MSGLDSITKRTCADQGYWLGNTTGQLFTVIDTPGFGKIFYTDGKEKYLILMRNEKNI